MQRVVIFGCTEFSAMLRWYVERDGDKVDAYCVDGAYISNRDSFDGLPLLPFEKIGESFPTDSHKFLLTVGYNQMNAIREKKFHEIRSNGYELYSYIHPSAILSSRNMGQGNILLENTVIGMGCIVGDANIFQMSVSIAHHTKIGSFNFFAPSVAIAGDVEIDNNCFFGINSTLKNGIIISKATLCGAGCYLDGSTEPYQAFVPSKRVLLTKRSDEVKLI